MIDPEALVFVFAAGAFAGGAGVLAIAWTTVKKAIDIAEQAEEAKRKLDLLDERTGHLESVWRRSMGGQR
jgi:hypothetical protein